MDPMTIATVASALYMLGDFAYHRWWYEAPKGKILPQEVSIPRAEEGARIPLIYGRTRSRGPILAWAGTPVVDTGEVANGWTDGSRFYRMDMFFIVGIGMDDGAGTNTVHGMWIGDNKAFPWAVAKEVDIVAAVSESSTSEAGPLGGLAVWYDGNAAQDLSSQAVGARIGGDPNLIPGFRKYISVLLYNLVGQWVIGGSPNVPAYSFDVSSYRDANNYPAVGVMARLGDDSNPVNVLWDLLKCTFGKLGISTTWLDADSFTAAAATLYQESHGYSRFIEDVARASEHILEILRQIDGVLYVDETTGKLKLKLIRSDYDPATVPHITKDNCAELVNFSASGWPNLINRLRVKYTDRSNDYQDNTEPAQNPANSTAYAQYSEEVVDMPGVHHAALAAEIASRELAWRSRPVMKCRAIVDRSFVRVNPGDVVKVTWQKPDIAGIIFRVAAVDRGTLGDGRIALDLIQDISYVHRGRIPEPPAIIDNGRIRGGVSGITLG